MTAIARAFDPDHPANSLVISDETVCFNNSPGAWRRITSRCADSDEVFITLTNEMTLPPGCASEVYRLRWNIEKAFDQQEQKLDERKAWAKSDTAKEIQAIAICLAHNLLQILKATLKSEEGIELSHTADKWAGRGWGALAFPTPAGSRSSRRDGGLGERPRARACLFPGPSARIHPPAPGAPEYRSPDGG
jgi:hypothetical protein